MYLIAWVLLVFVSLEKVEAEDPGQKIDNGPATPGQIYLTTCTDRSNSDDYNQRLCRCYGANNVSEVEEVNRNDARHLQCSCDSKIFTHVYKQALKQAYDIETIEIHPASEGQIEPREGNNLNNPNNQNKDPLRFVLPPNTQTITFESCKNIKFVGTLKPKALEHITIKNAIKFILATPLSKDLKSLHIKGRNSIGFDERTEFIKTGSSIIDEESTGNAKLSFENVKFPASSDGLFNKVRAESIQIKSSKFDVLDGSGTVFGDMDWEKIKSLNISNSEVGAIFDLGLDKNHAEKDNTITFLANQIESTCNKEKGQIITQCFLPEKKIVMDTYMGNKIKCKCEENGKCKKNATGIYKYLDACNDQTLEKTACLDGVGEEITLAMMKEDDSNCNKECKSLDICLITIKEKTKDPMGPLGPVDQEGIPPWLLIVIIIFILFGAACLFLTIIFCFPELFKLKPESTMYKPTERDQAEEGEEVPEDEPSYKQLMVNETNQTQVQTF